MISTKSWVQHRQLRHALSAVVLALALSPLAAAHANDLCEAPAIIPALPFDDTRDTTTATTTASDPVHSCTASQGSNSVWYSFTPATSGMVTAYTAGSSYDTVLAVYTGACGMLVEVACNDDTPGTLTSQVTLDLTAGTTYLFEVAGFEDSGGGTLEISLRGVRPADNDDCSAPTVIAALPFTDIADASAATTSPSDPLQSCTYEGPAQNTKSVWYSFTPTSDGMVRASTFPSSYDTVLTAYTGSCGALVEVTCNDDFDDGLQSEVVFPVTESTTYLFEVTEYEAGDATTLRFALDFIPPDAVAKAADKCQKAIKKSGLTFVTKKLASLGKCAGGVFKCVQTKSNDKRDACVEKAGRKCVGELAKIASEEGKLSGKILKACNEDLVSFANLTGLTGLDYDAVIDDCQSEFAIPVVDSAAAIAECVVRQHGCRAEKLLEVEHPRAKELIRVALGAQVPPVMPEGLTCLADHGGSGLDVEDEATGKAIEKCEATVRKAGAKFVKTKLKSLEKCVDKIFTCQQKKPGDAACMAKAQATCDKEFVKIDSAAQKLDLTVDKKCLESQIAYQTLRTAEAANLDVLGPECALHDVASLESIESYKQCLFQQHECRAEDLLRFAAPRAESLLGLVGRRLWSEFCPSP